MDLVLAQEVTSGVTNKGIAALGAGLAIGLGAGGGAIGIGVLWSKGIEAIGRQPEAVGLLRTQMITGFALAEAQVLYAFVITFLLLFTVS